MRKRPRQDESPPLTGPPVRSAETATAKDGAYDAHEDSEGDNEDEDDDLLAELENAVEVAVIVPTRPNCVHHQPNITPHGLPAASTDANAQLAVLLARENADAMLERLARQEEDAARAAQWSQAPDRPAARRVDGWASSPLRHTGGFRRASSFNCGPPRAFHVPAADGSDATQRLDDALLVHLLGFVGHRTEVGPAMVCGRWQACKVTCDRERCVAAFETGTRLGALLARALEVELFAACGATVGAHYWQRARSLVFNLRDRPPATSASSSSAASPPSSSSAASPSSATSVWGPAAAEAVPWWAEGGWACARCTLDNGPDQEHCRACDGLRCHGLLARQRAFEAPVALPAVAAAGSGAAAGPNAAGSSAAATTPPPAPSAHAAANPPTSAGSSAGTTQLLVNSLCARVLSGALSPRALAAMTAAQLATPELAAQKAEWEKQGALARISA
jgi:hypothetical protein